MKKITKQILPLTLAAGALTGCFNGFDVDMRDSVGNQFDTTNAARNGANGSDVLPDANGVIRYPTYSVVVARTGDTLQDAALRAGADPNAVAKYNGMTVDTVLNSGQQISLPSADRAGQDVQTTPLQTALGPNQHRVSAGETLYTISRIHGVTVDSLASLNALGANSPLTDGQILNIPQSAATTDTATTAPGEGSTVPLPPSSLRPQPRPVQIAQTQPVKPAQETAPVADTGQATEVSNTQTRLQRPVEGNIIRGFKKGSNEGVDISAPAGTAVKAANGGRVLAVTKDTNGITIMVIKHADNLLTVYTNIDNLTVAKGDSVTRGQKVAEVAQGSPSFIHFEVRDGLNAVNPDSYI